MSKLQPWIVLVACSTCIGALPDVQRTCAQEGEALSAHRWEAGVGARFMPTGWFEVASRQGNSFRAYPALGVAPFVALRLTRFFAVGLSPEITLNVIPKLQDYAVGEMYAGLLRIEGRYPNHRWVEPYIIASGGYSLISIGDYDQTSKGFLLEGLAGLRLKLGRGQSLFAEVGYQRGFQRLGSGDYSRSGGDYAPSYVVTSFGWQMAF